MAAFVEKLPNGKWQITAGHSSLDLYEVIEDWDMKDLARAVCEHPEFAELVLATARTIKGEKS